MHRSAAAGLAAGLGPSLSSSVLVTLELALQLATSSANMYTDAQAYNGGARVVVSTNDKPDISDIDHCSRKDQLQLHVSCGNQTM